MREAELRIIRTALRRESTEAYEEIWRVAQCREVDCTSDRVRRTRTAIAHYDAVEETLATVEHLLAAPEIDWTVRYNLDPQS